MQPNPVSTLFLILLFAIGLEPCKGFSRAFTFGSVGANDVNNRATRSIDNKITSFKHGPDCLLRKQSPWSNRLRRSVPSIHMQMYPADSAISIWAMLPDLVLHGPSMLWIGYESALEQFPLAVDALTGIVLYILGTLAAGVITKTEVPADRLLRWTIFGTLDGLLTHQWYHAIDAAGDAFGTGWEKVLFMISSDTLVYTPVYCFTFIVVMALMEGRGIHATAQQVRSELKELAQASVTAWLPFNAIIYALIPLRYRLPSAMMVHFVYSIGLALWEIGFFGSRKSANEMAMVPVTHDDLDSPVVTGNYTAVR